MTYENLNVFQDYVDDDTVNQLDVEKTILEVDEYQLFSSYEFL